MKVFASDYDGTFRLLEKVSEYDKKKVEEWRKQGNLFGLVTGRSIESILSEQIIHRFEYDFLICNNGGVIYDCDMNLLKMEFMHYQTVCEILKYVKELPIISYVLNDGFHRSKMILNKEIVDLKYGALHDFINEEDILKEKKISQLVLSTNDEALSHEISDFINKTYNEHVISYVNVNCVDIVPLGVSKEEGLKFLKDYYGWEEIYTIGDSYNDICMLEAFCGFSVQQAVDEVKKHANKVYKNVGECLLDLMKEI